MERKPTLPESWEDVNLATVESESMNTKANSRSDPVIIRTDFDGHTPFRPTMKILQRTGDRVPVPGGGAKDSAPSNETTNISLAERQKRYDMVRKKIFGVDDDKNCK